MDSCTANAPKIPTVNLNASNTELMMLPAMVTRYMRCSCVDFFLKRVFITVGVFNVVVANVAIIVETEYR